MSQMSESLRRQISSPVALFVFEAVARHGGFRAAALELNVTQPSVSYQIKNLEKHLGTMLFARRGRSISLTEDGETLYRAIERGFAAIQTGLAEIAIKKARKRLTLSPEGQAEIADFYQHTRENLRMAQAIFLSRDPELARRLVDQKIVSRKLEAKSAEAHLERMKAGRRETIETSTIHLDLLRDLKRVNAHLASVAYPILDHLGLLRESRLRSA